MSETYQDQISRVRMMADGGDTWDLSDNDIAALKATLDRLDLLESKAGKISCVHCGAVTEGATPEEMSENIRLHIVSCEKRPEVQLTRVIYSIMVALGATEDDWSRIPEGDEKVPGIVDLAETLIRRNQRGESR